MDRTAVPGMEEDMWRSLFCLAVLALTPVQAHAQTQVNQQSICAPRKEIVHQLAAKFGEAPVAIGLSEGGRLIEVLAGRNGDTFTVIVTSPQGLSCIVLTGDSWQQRAVTVAGSDT